MSKKNIQPKIEEMEKFSDHIMYIVNTDKVSYIDAITEYCEMIGLEIEIASKLITPFLLSKITEEAAKNNLIEKAPVLF